jgi:hypothetical protein
MKRLIFCLIFAAAAFANPAWYDKIPAKSYESIGYGASSTAEGAKSDAIKDIGDAIATVVVTESKVKRSVMRNAERVLSREAEAELRGAEIIRFERQGGGFFAAARLDRRPIEVRLTERLGAKRACREQSGGFLSRSPFAKSLNAKAGCAVDFAIWREADRWRIGEKKISLVWNEVDLTRLFDVSEKNATIAIAPLETAFVVSAEEEGFATIFSLYADGNVSLVTANEPIEQNRTIIVDPPAKNADLKAPRSFLIAVFSGEPIEIGAYEGAANFSRFEALIALLEEAIYSAIER